MNRLANVEAYRLSSVVDEALESLKFLSRLDNETLKTLSSQDAVFNNLFRTEQRYQGLVAESVRMDRRPKELDGAGHLDIVSVGASQLTQEMFGRNWDGIQNGGGAEWSGGGVE